VSLTVCNIKKYPIPFLLNFKTLEMSKKMLAAQAIAIAPEFGVLCKKVKRRFTINNYSLEANTKPQEKVPGHR
tara:strand:- start:52774 stop:52992 length:219 start_codon:yes stop_codon:yes gene_type:complete